MANMWSSRVVYMLYVHLYSIVCSLLCLRWFFDICKLSLRCRKLMDGSSRANHCNMPYCYRNIFISKYLMQSESISKNHYDKQNTIVLSTLDGHNYSHSPYRYIWTINVVQVETPPETPWRASHAKF